MMRLTWSGASAGTRTRISILEVTFFGTVTLLDRLADALNALLPRQHAADGEEAGLQDGVHPGAEAQTLCYAARVDDEEAQPLLDNVLLHRSRQLVPHGRCIVGRIEEYSRARPSGPQHIELSQKVELVDADE